VYGAYMAETIRAGILAVPKGQYEAARSLGMSSFRTMVSITLPQALRIVIPPLTNELVALLKDTSLIQVIGFAATERELTAFGSDQLNTFASPSPLMAVAVLYLVITLPLTRLVAWLERRGQRAR
jgi:polar amino acid transport system permease protein